jgi:glyoxylase-like metal-dependent hydrolase (beta-lactamase superfamily II)
MDEPKVIDTRMHGYEGVTAAYVVEGRDRTALVETGPKTSFEALTEGLESARVERIDWIVVTHIHLDHAGAAGTLAALHPEATVAVHHVGAPHLVDPSKLWKSATRIYGDRMDEMWGGIDPLPEDRIRSLYDGDVIDLGGRTLRAVDTPGHAGHHHAFVDDASDIVFTGDALGVKLQGIAAIRPATPPPEFNLELAIASIQRLRSLRAAAFWPTHFGPAPEPIEDLADSAIESLMRWAEWVREARAEGLEGDDAAAAVRSHARSEFEAQLDESDIARLEQTTSYSMNTSGYMRYLDRNEPA